MEESNEHNVESALVERDYSDRRILVLDLDQGQVNQSREVLEDLLTGAVIKSTSSIEEAENLAEAEEFDTFVVDFQQPSVSTSDFIKEINNNPDANLIGLGFSTFSLSEEERLRFKLEPLRKLFESEKINTKVKN